MKKIPIEISARHMHLSEKDLNVLFGENYNLRVNKKLSQLGEFAAQETVKIVGPKGEIKNIRIIGPIRKISQIEISKTDGYKIGIIPPVRVSGNIKDTPGVKVLGPNGELDLAEGLIIAHRHIHMNQKDAQELEVNDQQKVSVEVTGERGLIFNNVIVRVRDNFNLSFQIDTDEGNAGGIENGDTGELIL